MPLQGLSAAEATEASKGRIMRPFPQSNTIDNVHYVKSKKG